MQVYDAMVTEATRLECPRMWSTDLTIHDKAYLAGNRPTAFIWILRECGTHLIDLEKLSADEARQYLESVQRWFHNVVAIYVYDGQRLQHVLPRQAEVFIEQYHEKG